MNTFMKRSFRYKLHKTYHRFVHTETKLEKEVRWLKPDGHKTNILMYNSITKSKVPLILRNKNVLTWYICGPTVYDSAHIGHAITYVNTDIIRRILSDYYNINVVMAMCITNVDDKIITRSNETKQNYKDLAVHYENEFIEDMEMLNVAKPHIYCRVTDYVPQIIEFVKNILNKGKAYVLEDGSVYFDTEKYGVYGKLANPLSNREHSHKKSPMDFCLWKAAKENEPFWSSPWGPGRPGWHIECSTIASTIFGNSIDIHSGGIDLIFPHHENEEAQSCCYHEVEQWVNYWVHCGHLFLDDKKMSKSLKNTISIREFLKKYTSNQFRMLCLLSNYRTELKFSDEVMNNAVNTLHKIEHFASNCNSYIAGRWPISNIDEILLLQSLEETKNNVDRALQDDFNTAGAMKSLLNLIDITNKMLYDSQGISNTSNCIPAVATISNYISAMFTKFGLINSNIADCYKMNKLIEHFINFRTTVRNRVLEQVAKDQVLLAACDEARSNLSSCGVTMKDHKTQTIWSINKY